MMAATAPLHPRQPLRCRPVRAAVDTDPSVTILPTYTENHEWAWDQRQMQFNDLTHALEVMGHTATVPSPAEKLLLVWLLDNRCLHFDYQSQVMTLK